MEFLRAVHLVPVRHHSPRASAVLEATLDRVRPALVLVEGPVDGGRWIEVLTDRETRPPVALLAYRTDGMTGSSLWPIASYSPEYVALRWARAHGVAAAFIDVPSGVVLARGRGGESGADDETDDGVPFEVAAARATGHRSFEEMWEALIEAPRHDAASFSTAILAYAETVRSGGDRMWHRARDAYMVRRIREHIAGGVAAERIAVVVGAAHAAAFLAGDVDDGLADRIGASVATEMTVIPFSYPRLAEQTGYGAGNRAPLYYQRAHDAGTDYRRATLEVLVDFTERLRLRGFAVSLADTIEAYRLANTLAEIRGKAQPGLDEVREASIATLCRGEGAHMDGFLWPSVVGHGVGVVTARVGRNSLQEEFWREVRGRRLPETDELQTMSLLLANEVEIGTSIFLHRLRVAGVPYAGYRGAARGAGGESAGGIGALARVREAWEARWTPATDVALVESIVLGESIAEVAARQLGTSLASARSTGDAADVLAEAVLTRSGDVVAAALAACDARAAGDDELPSLTRACRALSYLVSYGSERGHLGFAAGSVGPLCEKTFARAVLRVGPACRTDDRGVGSILEALRSLHEIAMAQPVVDREGWLGAAAALVGDDRAHPQASGLACGLLYLARVMDEARVATIIGQRLSSAVEPAAGAGFLAGFLEVNALVLVKSRPVVEALDGFLMSIPGERFRDVLPILRRALSPLGATERRYLVEHIISLRGIGAAARQAAQVIAEKDVAVLKEMSAELGAAMDDLDDLL